MILARCRQRHLASVLSRANASEPGLNLDLPRRRSAKDTGIARITAPEIQALTIISKRKALRLPKALV